jgi:hypothetical protein
MRVMGAPAFAGEPITEELQAAALAGLPAFVWCDGEELVAVLADKGDTVADVLALVAKVVPA